MTTPEAPLVLMGKYQVLRRIGAGGMGVVLAVENVRTGGQFALKVLRRATVPDEMVRRFLLEARAAVRVKHPNVVQVFDLEDDPDTASLYIVQELLEGETLGARLHRDGALTVADTLAIAEPIMEALAHAHSTDVVHRDLKPDNVFLVRAPDGRCVPKLIDFGIAKLLDRGGGSILTADGMIGTPAYMSPEQIESPRSVDARTDVWSMGVLLVEMLTGECPFGRDSQLGTLTAVLTERVPRLDETSPGVPRHVADAVERALQRDRAQRHPTIASFLAALRGTQPPSYAVSAAVATPSPQAPPRNRAPSYALLALAGAATLLAGVAAVRLLSAARPDVTPTRAPLAALRPAATPIAPAPFDAAIDVVAAPIDAPAPVDAPSPADVSPRVRAMRRDASTVRHDPPAERTPTHLQASEDPSVNGAMSPQ